MYWCEGEGDGLCPGKMACSCGWLPGAGGVQWCSADEALEHVPAVVVLGRLLTAGDKGLCAPGGVSVAPGPGWFCDAGEATAMENQG